MKSEVIMFDMDGVLVDFLKAYRLQQRGLGLEPTMSDNWDDYNNARTWAAIRVSDTFWLEAEATVARDAFQRIDRLQRRNDVYFVTSRPGVDVKYQTEQWLKARGIDGPTVILSTRKAEIAKGLGADWSIEDKPGNAAMIAYWSPATSSYLLDAPYNRFPHHVIGRKVIRIDSVGAYLDAIERV